MPQRGVAIFIGLFGLVGLIAIGAGAWNAFWGLRSRSWPVAEAIIDGSEVKTQSGNRSTTYSPAVSYHYSVGGVSYSGDRLAFGTISASSRYASRIVAKYPVGTKVPIHYSPSDPQKAVLETGVHGGTWVAVGVGTIFVLFSMMMLQPTRPQAAGGDAAAPANAGQPPILLGLIFILGGSFACFAEPSPGVPKWIPYAAGAMFVAIGLYVMTYRLKNKIYSKILVWAALLTFMAIFHWVSFAPGERIGTSTTPFSRKTGVNVRTPFAVFTIVIDAIFVAVGARWVIKRVRGGTINGHE